MRRLASLVLLILAGTALAADPDPFRVLSEPPKDSRIEKPKDLNAYFPFTPPVSKAAWEKRRQELREQVLLANGLWPMPPKTPLNPVIHGKIDRDDYTIEKVFFASHPGHYVCGNLYRPKGKAGKLPGVLCPHGHWPNGRFYAKEKGFENDINAGAEKTKEGAMYPLQARCAMLARLGCVVFHYDMVGYADSQAIKHRVGFTDAEAELRQQNFMGLQTWNSIRALDFLTSLPEVDVNRIGVTGASGGGTQTFLLTAVDDRPTVAFPAVMVSTAMQGGCVCENCSYLRLDSGNIELAGLFAPKPQAMSCANDWTKEMETKGLPELKALYKLYGKEELVDAKHFPFPHNYNQVAREMMYNFFNKHLKLGHAEPIVEKPFVPVEVKDLSVFNAEHPLPKDAKNSEELRQYLTAISDKQIAALIPNDAEGLKEYRRVIGTAARIMLADRLPAKDEIVAIDSKETKTLDGINVRLLQLSRKGENGIVPAVAISAPGSQGPWVIWIHAAGKRSLWRDGKLVPAARRIVDKGARILAPDVFLTGELDPGEDLPVNDGYAGFTFGYNRSVPANRARDILTAVAFLQQSGQPIHLVGWEQAGPWVLLARSLCGAAVVRTAGDARQFRFDKIYTTFDEMLLPGAVKYGGLPALAALAAPHPLFIHNAAGTGAERWLTPVYQAAAANDRLSLSSNRVSPEKVVDWLLR